MSIDEYNDVLVKQKELHDELAELASNAPYGKEKTSHDIERYNNVLKEFVATSNKLKTLYDQGV